MLNNPKALEAKINLSIINWSSKIHKNVDLAEFSFDRVIELEPTNIGYYVLLSNFYTEVNNIDGILRIQLMMREKRLKKDPGYSYDHNHPQTKEIYAMLEILDDLVNVSSGSGGGLFHSERDWLLHLYFWPLISGKTFL